MKYEKLKHFFFILVVMLFSSATTIAFAHSLAPIFDGKFSHLNVDDTPTNPCPSTWLTMNNDEQPDDLYINTDNNDDHGLRINEASHSDSFLTQLWGTPAKNHLYLGMWTIHYEHCDDHNSDNKLVAVSYNGYFGGTFINSHYNTVWAAGVQRAWYQKQHGIFDVELGYRAGAMYGYKKFLRLCNTAFFPLLQVVADIDYKNFGIQLSWAGVVGTIGFLYKFN